MCVNLGTFLLRCGGQLWFTNMTSTVDWLWRAVMLSYRAWLLFKLTSSTTDEDISTDNVFSNLDTYSHIHIRECDTKGDTRWLWHDVLAHWWRPKITNLCDSFFSTINFVLQGRNITSHTSISLTLQLLSSFYTALPPGYEVHRVHIPDVYCKQDIWKRNAQT